MAITFCYFDCFCDIFTIFYIINIFPNKSIEQSFLLPAEITGKQAGRLFLEATGHCRPNRGLLLSQGHSCHWSGWDSSVSSGPLPQIPWTWNLGKNRWGCVGIEDCALQILLALFPLL